MSTPGTDVFFHCRQSPILFGSREAAGYKQMYKAVQKKKNSPVMPVVVLSPGRMMVCPLILFRIKQPSRLIGMLRFFKFSLNFPLAMLWINSLDGPFLIFLLPPLCWAVRAGLVFL